MTDPVERRAAALLADLFAQRQVRPAALAAELGLTFREMDRLLGGEGSLDLGKLESILTALGVQPGEFFARLYAHSGAEGEELGREAAAGGRRSGLAEAGPVSTPPAQDPPLNRLEVETVLGTVRSMVAGMIRRLDAEEAMERERGAAGPV